MPMINRRQSAGARGWYGGCGGGGMAVVIDVT